MPGTSCFVDIARDTLRPYLNSVVVALASTLLAVLFGSLAAYALVRIRFQVKLAAVALFILLLARGDRRGRDASVPTGGSRSRSRSRSSSLPRARSAAASSRALGNNDIEFWIISNRIMPPVVAVLPIYVMFQQLQPARHAGSR